MISKKLEALVVINQLVGEVETVKGQMLIGKLIELIGDLPTEQQDLKGGEQSK